MPSLKDLRVRITSVKSTQKITSAMKMVAASKLKRSQDAVVAAKPYAKDLETIIVNLANRIEARRNAEEADETRLEAAVSNLTDNVKNLANNVKKRYYVKELNTAKSQELPSLFDGTGKENAHLLIVLTSDRGLCGGFNSSVARAVRDNIRQLEKEEKTVKILCIGRKGRDALKREFGKYIINTLEGVARKGASFVESDEITLKIIEMFENSEFDVCSLVYNKFISAMKQEVTFEQVIPFKLSMHEEISDEEIKHKLHVFGPGAVYEYEPSEQEILEKILPRNLAVKIFNSILESQASEHGSRMTSMDSATRNASEMIDKLSIKYNRTRQAFITKELIEIISGAEAV